MKHCKGFIVMTLTIVSLALPFHAWPAKQGSPVEIKGSAHKLVGETYRGRWEAVEAFEEKDRPQSALKEVEAILNLARRDRNAPQIVKAQIHRIKYLMQIGTHEHPAIIRLLEKEAAAAEFPERQILISLLAECYWNYFAANRYLFYMRTETTGMKEDDVATWSPGKLFDKTIALYLESLSPADKLKTVPIDAIEPILERGTVPRSARPTLYDLLAHRAVDFFMIDEHQLTRPAVDFEIDSPSYFGDAEEFAAMELRSNNPTSLRYRALVVFQDLTRFHLNDAAANPYALVDVELKRLSFVREKATLPEKEDLYLDALQRLERRFAGSPVAALVRYHIARWYAGQGLTWREGDPSDHRWSLKKARDMAMEIIQRFPDSEAARLCLPLTAREKNLSVTSESMNPQGKPFRILVKYKNIDRVHLRAVLLNDELNRYLESESHAEKRIAKLASAAPVHSWSQAVPDDGDLREHSVEIRVPALNPGRFVILAASDPSFSSHKNATAYLTVSVSNLAFVHRVSHQEGLIIHVYHRESGALLSGVNVTCLRRVYNSSVSRYEDISVGKTASDHNGRVKFTLPDNGRYQSYKIILEKGDDRLESGLAAYAYDRSPEPQMRAYFFTDRAIYRPGQTIYFKAVILRLDQGRRYTISPDTDTKVELRDRHNNRVASLPLRSNRFGTVSGSFTAPSGTLTGTITIANEWGYSTLRLEEYRRPRFEVGFDPVKGSYRLGEAVTVKGRAISYAGAPLTGSKVVYRVERRVWFPYRWWGWYVNYFSGRKTAIAKGETATDATGAFAISFEALPDPRIPAAEQPSFYYEVSADVTDITGETHTAQTTLVAGYTSIILNIDDLSSAVNSKAGLSFTVKASNYAGESVPTNVTCTIARVKDAGRLIRPRMWSPPDRRVMTEEEFVRSFPHDPYANEDDPANRGTEPPVFSSSLNTNKEGKIEPSGVASWKEGRYLVTLEAADPGGQRVRTQKYFTLYHAKSGPTRMESYLFVTPLESSAHPGTSVRLLIGSSANVHVLLDIIRPEHRIESSVINLKAEQRVIEVPVSEADRGNICYRYAMIADGRLVSGSGTIVVPWDNMALKAEFMTFRNRLKPGEKEEWRIRIAGSRGEAVAAEITAAMYDASLDAFVPHGWQCNVWPTYYPMNDWQTNETFDLQHSILVAFGWNESYPTFIRSYDSLNLFGLSFYSRGRIYMYKSGFQESNMDGMVPKRADKKEHKKEEAGRDTSEESAAPPTPSEDSKHITKSETAIQVRRNLNETAFFFPHLLTDEQGNVVISFTAPEALTRWRLLGFAHTQDFKHTVFQNELVTQKDLMVTPNIPRFFRSGDVITISAKVTNMTNKKLNGTATLLLFDASTMQPADASFANDRRDATFNVDEKGNTVMEWTLRVPAHVEAVTWRITARAGSFSDGEESTAPILSNRILITESLPLSARGGQTRRYTFKKLAGSKGSSVTHHRLTLEYTSNPAWYAVLALPYLIEFPHECAEQVFARFYANSLGFHIVSANSHMRSVFESWRNSGALLSNLQKNEELKSVLLEETPWLLAGRNEEESKKKVALLFDKSRMQKELAAAKRKLAEMQGANGGWSWFAGLPESRYITQHILAGLAKLRSLGVKEAASDDATTMMHRAVSFVDEAMNPDYNNLVKYKANLTKKNISPVIYHYLYVRSFFKEKPVPEHCKKAFAYWKKQAAAHWPGESTYLKGMAAIALMRFGETKAAREIITSLKEYALHDDDLGMYWKDTAAGFLWWQAPVETQSLLIEAFAEVNRDERAIDEMRTWLLKMKQVQHWRTTKATTDACYAILMGGSDWFSRDQAAEVYLADERIEPQAHGAAVEAGTGYFKVSWNADRIRPEMGTVRVVNPGPQPSWGALYWQYFEDLDKITGHATPLKLEKKLFLVKYTDRGEVMEPLAADTYLKPGDRVRVRIVLRSDKVMDYLHLKDLRPAGMEPVNVLSGYRYQDGLWYYESTRDAATHFFIERIGKGTYVFEYPLVVTLKGDFSAGIATIQCMYAPEFTAHSEGSRVRVR